MRILVLGSALLAVALSGMRPTPAEAAGPWCYLNEEEHCTEVSFEMCHFGTLGNGGYCYPNRHYRWHPQPESAALVHTGPEYNRWHDNEWGRFGGYASSNFRGQQQAQMITMGPGYGWCYGWGRCAMPSLQPFGIFGYGGYRYDSGYWYIGASWHPRLVHRHKYQHRPHETIASATINDQPDAPAPLVNRDEFDASDPRLVMASADHPRMVSVEALSSSNDKATSIGASKRAANRVPAIDVFPSCRAGANVGLDQSIDVCLAAETSARDHLARDWDQFSQTDRSSCVRVATLGGGGSYTALLSCIEMKQYARDLPKENASVLVAGK